MGAAPSVEVVLTIETWEPLSGWLRDAGDLTGRRAFSGWIGLAVALREVAGPDVGTAISPGPDR